MNPQVPTTAAFLGALLLGPILVRAEPGWPQWRGPKGTGHSQEHDLPVHWDAAHVVWSTPLTGRGHSSPVAWGDRLFLTVAAADGSRRSVVCHDVRTGQLLWEQAASSGEPEMIHAMNSWATPTCATDGRRVVAFFGDGGLDCFDLDGKPLWSRDLGSFETAGWGMASSPVLVGELVIQTCDGDNLAFVAAFDKQTGQEVWRTERPAMRSFSTPVLIDTPQRRELVINAHDGMRAYDPTTGSELWYVTGASGRGTPSVVPGAGLVLSLSGRSQGESDLMAVRPGGTGDVTASGLAWQAKRGGRDLPSPIVVDDYLCTVNLRPGIAACYEVATGRELWKQRLTGNFSASPIAVDGLVYLLNESGETYVVKPDREYREVARNRLDAADDEVFRASPMPYAGRLFLRSDKRLYCIGKTATPSAGVETGD